MWAPCYNGVGHPNFGETVDGFQIWKAAEDNRQGVVGAVSCANIPLRKGHAVMCYVGHWV